MLALFKKKAWSDRTHPVIIRLRQGVNDFVNRINAHQRDV